ncbi:hypothetical protein [Legionella brunensis]|uniref:Uncharacterized protein n=1 Tax=Legionella brunensis TaxID=29422 RepID=A0A0W0SNS2_9GAMM|nr:hypothetical protein [Legionella brunensis]KTC85030.1 hypothetical protein Lbru_1245 [Legionella brunensis]
MRSVYHRVHYRAMPSQSRFGVIFGVLHNEACYTDEELQFRTRVITARRNSGLDADLLQTSNTWFADNQDTALRNVNENSWFFNPEYLPRQEISTEDFHIGLIDNQRLQWSGLATMTRIIGDYLLLRNNNLAPNHLNQPMNYVLLDAVQMLRRLAMSNNPEYVTTQLELLHNYLRTIEIHTSPTIGSDRLFLSDCRRFIEDEQAKITNQIHSRQLRTHVERVQQQLNQVAELRHTILHFALSAEPVNPHPYLDRFAANQGPFESNKEFPTLAARACATVRSDELTKIEENSSSQRLASLELSATTLANCQGFRFVPNLPEQAQIAYSSSLVELQEILRFQGIVEQLLQVFEQAGEVFTVIQFREQMTDLLKNIEQFIQHSQQNILMVLETNADIYHEAIQAKQDLHWWEKLLTNRQEQIDGFIKNQDNLARFDTTPNNLQLASKELLAQVNQITTQLNQHTSEDQQLELVSSTRGLIKQLMSSMHAWIGRQYELKGLPIPEKQPEKLTLVASNKPHNAITAKAIPEKLCLNKVECEEPQERVQTSSASQNAPFFRFWSPAPAINQPPSICASDTNCPPQRISCEETSSSSQSTISPHLALGLLILLPIGILALKLLYDRWQTSKVVENNDPAAFDQLKTATEDLLCILNNLIAELDDPYLKDQLIFLDEDYKALLEKAGRNQYDTVAMQELYEELDALHEELTTVTKMKLN